MDRSIIPIYAKWVCLGFLAGVLVHAARPLASMSVLIPVSAFMFGLLFRRTYALVFMIAFVIGFYRFELTIPGPEDGLMKLAGEQVTLDGSVRDVRTYDVLFRAEEPQSRSLISLQPGGRRLGAGDRIRITCNLAVNDSKDMKRRLFDARNHIHLRCRGAVSVESIGTHDHRNLSVMLAAWRSAISGRIRSILPGDEGALLSGILYGERSLSRETNEAFRHAGMTHLIAVSGSNITLVVSLFVPILVGLGYRRRSAIFLSGFGILLFTLFTGAGASVVRAAIMGWLAMNARYVGRKARAVHLLLLAATFMILFDPWALAFDAGFALSFLATWGLLAWSRPIADRLICIPERFALREIVATTIAATFVTTPYLFWAFDQTTFAGLITNIFAIPLVGMSMAFGVIAAAFGEWIPLVTLPAEGSLRAMLWIANLSELAPWLRVGFHLPTWGLFLAYGAMTAHWMLRTAKKKDYPQNPWEGDRFEGISKALVRPF